MELLKKFEMYHFRSTKILKMKGKPNVFIVEISRTEFTKGLFYIVEMYDEDEVYCIKEADTQISSTKEYQTLKETSLPVKDYIVAHIQHDLAWCEILLDEDEEV